MKYFTIFSVLVSIVLSGCGQLKKEINDVRNVISYVVLMKKSFLSQFDYKYITLCSATHNDIMRNKFSECKDAIPKNVMMSRGEERIDFITDNETYIVSKGFAILNNENYFDADSVNDAIVQINNNSEQPIVRKNGALLIDRNSNVATILLKPLDIYQNDNYEIIMFSSAPLNVAPNTR